MRAGLSQQRKGPAGRTGRGLFAWPDDRPQASRLPSRRRATRVAAAAPNSRIIGGAGTRVPLEVEEVPPLEVELDVELAVELDELVLEQVLALVLDEVEVLVAPKLLDEIWPLDVEVELPPVDVELPPVDVEVELRAGRDIDVDIDAAAAACTAAGAA